MMLERLARLSLVAAVLSAPAIEARPQERPTHLVTSQINPITRGGQLQVSLTKYSVALGRRDLLMQSVFDALVDVPWNKRSYIVWSAMDFGNAFSSRGALAPTSTNSWRLVATLSPEQSALAEAELLARKAFMCFLVLAQPIETDISEDVFIRIDWRKLRDLVIQNGISTYQSLLEAVERILGSEMLQIRLQERTPSDLTPAMRTTIVRSALTLVRQKLFTYELHSGQIRLVLKFDIEHDLREEFRLRRPLFAEVLIRSHVDIPGFGMSHIHKSIFSDSRIIQKFNWISGVDFTQFGIDFLLIEARHSVGNDIKDVAFVKVTTPQTVFKNSFVVDEFSASAISYRVTAIFSDGTSKRSVERKLGAHSGEPFSIGSHTEELGRLIVEHFVRRE